MHRRKNSRGGKKVRTDLREGSIVPDVSVMRETIANVSELAAFDVLLDGVERFLLGNLHLCIRPAWNLNNHV